MSSCLFCSSTSCTNPSGNVKETPTLIKNEVFITVDNDNDDPLYNPVLPEINRNGSNPTEAKEYLNASFILQNILKIPQHFISQLLKLNRFQNGEVQEDEMLLCVCASCEKTVAQFYDIFKQVQELERKLAGIEKELKWKMQITSSQVPACLNSSVYEQIRSQVLNTNHGYADEDPLREDEHGSNIVDERWMAGANDKEDTQDDSFMELDHSIINDEHHHKYADETQEFKVNHLTNVTNNMSSTSSTGTCHYSSLFLDANQDDEEELRIDSKADVTPLPLPVPASPSSSSFNEAAKTKTVEVEDGFGIYKCAKCPYNTDDSQRLNAHRKLHEEGSEAVACPVCGWFTLPGKMRFHHGQRHSANAKAKKVKLIEKFGAQGGRHKGLYYQCPECSALGPLNTYQDHERLHHTGAGFNCEKCGWLCSHIAAHKRRWHPHEKSSKYSEIPPRHIVPMKRRPN